MGCTEVWQVPAHPRVGWADVSAEVIRADDTILIYYTILI